MSRRHHSFTTFAVAGVLLLAMIAGQLGLAHIGRGGAPPAVAGGPAGVAPEGAARCPGARVTAAGVFDDHGLDHCFTCRWLRSLRLPLSPLASGEFQLPADARLQAAVFVAPDPATVESLSGRSPPRL
jgi:hypothetical protein